MVVKQKELCHCGNIAVWVYMPNSDFYYCEDCISSKDDVGCSCNWENLNDNRTYTDGADTTDNLPKGEENIDWRWVEQPESHGIKVTKEDGYWIQLDDRQRPYPCCEYSYSETGFYTDEYENYLETECERIGYDLISDAMVKELYAEYNYILWTDELINKIEKIIKEHNN